MRSYQTLCSLVLSVYKECQTPCFITSSYCSYEKIPTLSSICSLHPFILYQLYFSTYHSKSNKWSNYLVLTHRQNFIYHSPSQFIFLVSIRTPLFFLFLHHQTKLLWHYSQYQINGSQNHTFSVPYLPCDPRNDWRSSCSTWFSWKVEQWWW